MKRLFCLVVAVLCIAVPGISSADKEISIPAIKLELTLADSWLYIDRATEASSLQGSRYDNEVFYNVIQQVQSILSREEHRNIYGYMYYVSEGTLLECQLLVNESKGSRDAWDIALAELEPLEDEHFLEYYTSKAGDIYQGMDMTAVTTQECEKLFVYSTVNNGRAISLHVLSAYPVENVQLVSTVHELLDSIRFTEKAPKPAQALAHGALDWVLDAGKRVFTNELSHFVRGMIWLAAIAVIMLAGKLISVVFSRR